MASPTSATLRWLGHSCYGLSSPAGVNLLIDPIPADMGYPVARLPNIDLLLISHEHYDHNNVALAPGNPKIVRGTSAQGWNPGTVELGDVAVTVIAGAYHDQSQGAERGRTALFSIATAGLKILHLGDLGHGLDVNLLAQTRGHDVVCVPVGGVFTIDAATAAAQIDALAPRMVIPMHYRTERLPAADWPIESLEESGFLEGRAVRQAASTSIELDRAALPAEQHTLVFPTP